MSKEALDELIRKAVRDPAFRSKLTDPARLSELALSYELTEDEMKKLRRLGMEQSSLGFPFAQGLDERLAK
jgi:hypothetical protein